MQDLAIETFDSGRLEEFENSLASQRRRLLEHPIYRQVRSLPSLRIFMANHIFAVWDFMSLLKTLQMQLTCTRVPWLPPPHIEAARFINEIVVGEETDEVQPGIFTSHFDLYLKAMQQTGADMGPILSFTQSIAQGTSVARAFTGLKVAPKVQEFVTSTLHFCGMQPHQVAAVFLYGREDIIPEMFKALLHELNLYSSPDYAQLKLYLERHIQVDGESHGPLARKMLISLCGDSEQRWSEALQVARQAMQNRGLLWDGISYAISSTKTMQ